MSNMTRSWRQPLVAAPLCALALVQAAGCSSPAGPTTGPCFERTLFSGETRIPADTYLVQRVTMSQPGRLDVTLDWGLDTNIVSFALAQAPCTVEQFGADTCNVLLNLFPPPKPLEGSTYWLNAGTYDLILGNFSPTEEIASTKVTFSSTGCQIDAEK
jgi:hypothetical protein